MRPMQGGTARVLQSWRSTSFTGLSWLRGLRCGRVTFGPPPRSALVAVKAVRQTPRPGVQERVHVPPFLLREGGYSCADEAPHEQVAAAACSANPFQPFAPTFPKPVAKRAELLEEQARVVADRT